MDGLGCQMTEIINYINTAILFSILGILLFPLLKDESKVDEIKDIPMRTNQGMKPFAKSNGKTKPIANDDSLAAQKELEREH